MRMQRYGHTLLEWGQEYQHGGKDKYTVNGEEGREKEATYYRGWKAIAENRKMQAESVR